MTSGLASLPVGWSASATAFSCSTVSTANACLLTLTYAPTADASGTLTLNYSYSDNAGASKSGSVNVAYTATAQDNVVGAVSPSGQIATVAGSGAQAVVVGFTTDDGNPATDLILTTSLAALPSGWSSAATGFTCNTVSTGNGCELVLSYAPTADVNGVLDLSYTYTDNSGGHKTGSVSISYVATEHDNVVGTPAPSGQINAVLNSGSQSVNVNFVTDDGNPATDLRLTTALSSLPTGWSSAASSFGCDTLGTGTGCQLALTYAPTAVGGGTLSLGYTYVDNAGASKSGTVSISYTATAHDNVVGTASPSGQVSAVVGSGSQTVQVTFTTDDGNAASALTLTTALNSLPSGWSSSQPMTAIRQPRLL